jgi:hypothetical protein
MLVEYGVIDATVVPIVKLVDHHDLNTLNERCSTKEAAAVAVNPTVELLAEWFAVRLPLLASTRTRGADLPTDLAFDSLMLEEDSRASVEWRPGAGAIPEEG